MNLQDYKIVFAGNMGAGKTAAIQSISEIEVLCTEALNTDVDTHRKQLTTVGIDYGEITLDDQTTIGLYGTPGQERFSFLWDMISQSALGIIILINHTVEDPIEKLETYLSNFSKLSSNIVIGITHIDKKSKNSPAIYRQWEDTQQPIYPLFFIDARIKDDILVLIEALLSNAEVNLENI